MSELISGKDALIALANGERLQYRFPDSIWLDFTNNLNSSGSNLKVVDLLNDYAAFRLKPRTIKINGVELQPPKEVNFESDFGLLLHFENHEQRQKFKEALRSVFNESN